MPFKIVEITDAGTAIKYGADDLSKVCKILSNYDLSATDPISVATSFTFTNSALRIRDPADTHTYIINAANGAAADITVTVPVPGGGATTDTFLLATSTLLWSKVSKTGSKLSDIADTNMPTPLNGQVPTWNSSTSKWVNQTPPGAASGEINTASNAGTGGIGITLTKVGVDLPFKSIKANSSMVSITNDAINKNVLVDIIPGNINITTKGQLPASTVFNDQVNTWGAFLQTFGGAVALQSYTDVSVITIPSNPATSKGRVYMKQIDSNNDGLFVLKKINGSIAEVQIA